MSKLTKNQKLALSKIEAGKVYTLKEASALVKEITTTKFDASVDVDVRLGVAACSVSESFCNGGRCTPVKIIVEDGPPK